MDCHFCQKFCPSESVLCRCCGHFKPFEKLDYFALYNLKQNFKIDIQYIENKQFNLQSDVHPDRFVSGVHSDTSRFKAMQCSVYLNDAYETLSDDLKRAIYIFEINGLENPLDRKDMMDQDMMIRQMEWRERMEEESVETLKPQLQREVADLLEDLSQSFDKKDFAKAAKLTIELSFYKKIKKEMKLRGMRV